MTKITFINKEEECLKFIKVKRGEVTGMDTIWYSTKDIELSSSSNLQQETLATLKRKAENWEPTFVDDNPEGKHIPIYRMARTVLKVKYLKIRNEVRDSFWYAYHCVPHEDGLVTIDSLHPESDLHKKISNGTFVDEGKYPLVFKNETISACESCGTHARLNSCGSYNEEGEATDVQHLCSNCQTSQGYTFENAGVHYDVDIRRKLTPGDSFQTSYMFGGILNYSFRTTSSNSGMDCFLSGKGDTKKAPYLGVELEVAGTAGVYSKLHQYSKEAYRRVKKGLIANCSDSSLSGNTSFEIKTIPAKLNYLKDELKNLFKDDLFTKDIPSKNFSHGMHVHIDRASLRPIQLSKMVTFMNSKENKGFLEYVAGRTQTSYTEYHDVMRKIKKHSVTGGGTAKYSALNLSPEKTVEIRIFNAPESYEQFCYRLEFCEALVVYCGSFAGFNQLSYSDFIKWVLDGYGYPHLNKLLKSLKYKEVSIPLNSICSATNKTKRRILSVAGELDRFDVTTGDGKEQFLKKFDYFIKIVRKQPNFETLVNDMVRHLWKRSGGTENKFFKLINEDILEGLTPELYFHIANGSVPKNLQGGPSTLNSLKNTVKAHFKHIPESTLTDIDDMVFSSNVTTTASTSVRIGDTITCV